MSNLKASGVLGLLGVLLFFAAPRGVLGTVKNGSLEPEEALTLYYLLKVLGVVSFVAGGVYCVRESKAKSEDGEPPNDLPEQAAAPSLSAHEPRVEENQSPTTSIEERKRELERREAELELRRRELELQESERELDRRAQSLRSGNPAEPAP